jgi:hypothetical protein
VFKPIEVKPLPDYKIWMRYSDGSEGTIDLSEFAGRGVFKLWDDYGAFERVYIGEHGQVAWSDEIDMCPDALYFRLTGKTPEEVFPNLKQTSVDA